MFSEGSKLYTVAKMKCPRCNKGDVFKTKKLFQSKFDEMHERCSNCGMKYEREIGFFYGAMYVGYGLSVALSLVVFVITYVLFDIPTWLYLVLNALLLIGLVPLNYRLSRLIWLAMFVKYEPEKRGN